MITDKQIEEAQESIFEDKFLNNEVDTLLYDNDDSDPVYTSGQVKEAIELGAHWAIEQFLKNLWHDAKEEPKRNACIIAEYPCKESKGVRHAFIYDAEAWVKHHNTIKWNRWLYIDELLKGGENG